MSAPATKQTRGPRTGSSDPARLRTTQEAADYLGVGKSTLRAMVARGEVPAIRWNGIVRFDPADLEAFIRRHRS